MFIELVESNRKAKRSPGGTIVSVALHTALISLAIAATANARTKQPGPPEPAVRIIFVGPRPIAPATPAVAPRPVKPQAARSIADVPRTVLMAPVAVPTGIPEVANHVEPLSLAVGPIGDVHSDNADDNGGARYDGPLTALQVDREVSAFPSNRSPVYPDVLRSSGVEGEVFARFVVDESGRVNMKTLEIVSASNSAFSTAVRHALERARFQPAEAAGRKVAQLVEQRFQFRLTR